MWGPAYPKNIFGEGKEKDKLQWEACPNRSLGPHPFLRKSMAA